MVVLTLQNMFIDHVALAKQGDNELHSVCQSISQCVSLYACWERVNGKSLCLCVCKQGAYAENLTKAVDRLLIHLEV